MTKRETRNRQRKVRGTSRCHRSSLGMLTVWSLITLVLRLAYFLSVTVKIKKSKNRALKNCIVRSYALPYFNIRGYLIHENNSDLQAFFLIKMACRLKEVRPEWNRRGGKSFSRYPPASTDILLTAAVSQFLKPKQYYFICAGTESRIII